MMTKARSLTTFSVERLTNIIHGGPQKVAARRAAWSRVEAVLGTDNTSVLPDRYAFTSREDLYIDGLRMGKAAWDDQLEHKHDIFLWITPRYTLCNYSPFGLTTTLFANTVELMGTEEQRVKWLEPLRRGEINGAYAQTELGHGSFVRGLETTATFDPSRDCFILESPTLTSTKFWPGALGFSATHAVVMAQLVTNNTNHGVHPFVIQLRDRTTGAALPGIELGDVGHKPSYNQTDNGYARFNGVVVPRTDMLMGHASVSQDGIYRRRSNAHPKAAYGTMLVGRSEIAWLCSMQLAAAVTIAVRYSTVRQQGFSPLAHVSETHERAIFQHRTQHSRLLMHLARAYAILFASRHGKSVCNRVVWKKEHQTQTDTNTNSLNLKDAHVMLAGLKAWATTVAADGAEDCRKACGGMGYLAISGLPDLVQSATALCTLEGENTVLWQQVARYLLNWAPKLNLTLTQTRTPTSNPTLTESRIAEEQSLPRDLCYLRNQYHKKCEATTSPGFLDHKVQLSIFRHRAQRLMVKASHAMSHAISGGKKTPEVAWDETSPLLMSTARAHVEYIILEAFVEAVAELDDGSAEEKLALSRLCSLFALSAITDMQAPGSSQFVEDGFLSEAQVDQIRGQVNSLLDLLVLDAIGLTDAWDFTDAGLGSAIGRKQGDVYETVMAWTRQLPINVAGRAGQGVARQAWEEFIKPATRARL